MKPSIVHFTKECFYCGKVRGLQVHHICNGPFRKKSETYGGWLYVCPYHHTLGGRESIHGNPSMEKALKKMFQIEFEKLYGEEKWMNVFKKNYKV